MTIRLNEAAVLKGTGSKRRCRIIAEGQGSSGFYTEAVLREYGPKAFPVGTHSFVNHKTMDEEYNRPARDVRDIAGVLVSEPVFEDGALWGDIQFTEAASKLINEIGEHVGLSISANGTAEEVDGALYVTSIVESPLNSIDIVTRAGAGGKIMELVENFREANADQSTTTVVENNTERIHQMDEKDIERIAEAVASAIAPSLTALTEALKPAVKPEDEIVEGPDFAAVAEAVVESDLPKAVRGRIFAAVKEGAKVEDAIAEQKTLVESIKTDLAAAASVGKIQESGSTEYALPTFKREG